MQYVTSNEVTTVLHYSSFFAMRSDIGDVWTHITLTMLLVFTPYHESVIHIMTVTDQFCLNESMSHCLYI